MDLLFCLRDILSDFRYLFNPQNFALFQAFIFGFIANRGHGTLTDVYQCSASETKYWSFPKFLSRGEWNADAVAVCLLKKIQGVFPHWVYVYDVTKALKTGGSQWGVHFFRTFNYHAKHRVNPSKFTDWKPPNSFGGGKSALVCKAIAFFLKKHLTVSVSCGLIDVSRWTDM